MRIANLNAVEFMPVLLLMLLYFYQGPFSFTIEFIAKSFDVQLGITIGTTQLITTFFSNALSKFLFKAVTGSLYC